MRKDLATRTDKIK